MGYLALGAVGSPHTGCGGWATSHWVWWGRLTLGVGGGLPHTGCGGVTSHWVRWVGYLTLGAVGSPHTGCDGWGHLTLGVVGPPHTGCGGWGHLTLGVVGSPHTGCGGVISHWVWWCGVVGVTPHWVWWGRVVRPPHTGCGGVTLHWVWWDRLTLGVVGPPHTGCGGATSHWVWWVGSPHTGCAGVGQHWLWWGHLALGVVGSFHHTSMGHAHPCLDFNRNATHDAPNVNLACGTPPTPAHNTTNLSTADNFKVTGTHPMESNYELMRRRLNSHYHSTTPTTSNGPFLSVPSAEIDWGGPPVDSWTGDPGGGEGTPVDPGLGENCPDWSVAKTP